MGTGTRLFGPAPLLVVLPPNVTTANRTSTASQPDVVDLRTPPAATGPTAQARTDCAVLHGWLEASAVMTLLDLIALPTMLRVRAAVEHAARSTDRTAPGSAALCGLARALLSKFTSPQRIAHDVAERARRLIIGIEAFPHNGSASALHSVVELARERPDDPTIVAPLFVRQHRLRAGETLAVQHNVPLMVLSGGLDVHPADGDEVVAGAPTTTAPGAPGAPVSFQRLANALAPTPALPR